ANGSQYFVIFNTQGVVLPKHLLTLIPSFNCPLPELEKIKQILEEKLGNSEFVNERLALAVSGLSQEEIRLGTQLINSGCQETIREQLILYKTQQLKNLGLEFMVAPEIPTFGGLDNVKQAIEQVALDYTQKARLHKIPLPKGWLLVGPPGTGKTFAAKVCATKLGFPLISVGVDLVKSKGSVYLKQLLLRIESASPAVCYFDEFDKFFDPDTASTGSGQSKEVLGVLLTWLQEKQTQTFVIATLNRLDALPPELTRAGRFDRIFYVGFPQAIERKEILQLHASRFDSRYREEDGPLTQREWRILLARTQNFTGAELSSVVEKAAKTKFYSEVEQIALDLEALLQARAQITPLFIRDTERILAMENRARFVSEPASSTDTSIFAPPDVDLWGDKN
ncbi:MAG: ATP-binding protein, partial [Microcystaceae cyanobacterium]